jgi:hypothetical protein
MSRVQRNSLLVTFALALSFVFGSNVQTTAKPLPVTTADSQTSRASVDWCCVAGLACCVPEPK